MDGMDSMDSMDSMDDMDAIDGIDGMDGMGGIDGSRSGAVSPVPAVEPGDRDQHPRHASGCPLSFPGGRVQWEYAREELAATRLPTGRERDSCHVGGE